MALSSKNSDSGFPNASHIAYFNGRWVDASELAIRFDDIGFRQSAIAVERLRTYNGNVFRFGSHFDRWQNTVDALMISGLPNESQLRRLFGEMMDRNADWVDQQGDVGITMVATPGPMIAPAPMTAPSRIVASAEIERAPMLALHLNALSFDRIRDHQMTGQPIVITDVVQPPIESWPRAIKVRCRLHYYLADHAASATHAGAAGILLDTDGSITESSSCNIAIVCDGSIISPSANRVLGGVTQAVIEQLASKLGLLWTKRPIQTREMAAADEILLMGTDSGLWFANSVNRAIIADGQRGPICKQLQSAFERFVDANE